MRPGAALVAFVWTLVAAAVLALAPFGETTSATMVAGDGTSPTSQVVETTHESLLEHEGASVLVVFAVPALLALGGWLAARRGWRPGVVAAAVAMGAGVVLALLSVGLFYVPAAVAMAVAAARR